MTATDAHNVAEACRPRLEALARDAAKLIRRVRAGQAFPHTFEGMAILYLEGAFRLELVGAGAGKQ